MVGVRRTLCEMKHTRQDTAADLLIGNILALMGRRRVSQGEIAHVLGLSQPAVSRRFTENPDQRVSFNVDELEAIASYFDVPITRLFDESGWLSEHAARPLSFV